jgi:DNA-binding CsgD family transcriptional regulator
MDPVLGKGWTPEYADSVERAYKTFLSIAVKHQEHAEDIMLSKDVDEFWHTHILQTMKYADHCEAVFGAFLHHAPHVGKLTQADHEKRTELTDRTRTSANSAARSRSHTAHPRALPRHARHHAVDVFGRDSCLPRAAGRRNWLHGQEISRRGSGRSDLGRPPRSTLHQQTARRVRDRPRCAPLQARRSAGTPELARTSGQLLAEGHSVAEIAPTLSLSPNTVETYRARTMEKLGIHELAGLVRFAIQQGVTSAADATERFFARAA